MLIETPFGPADLQCRDGSVRYLRLFVEQRESPEESTPADAMGLSVKSALAAYFDRAEPFPEYPLQPEGSDYCQRVWQQLLEIPFGQTVTYGQLASKLSSGPRAIAQACRRNPIPLLIPCHRVVAANGVGGYSGAALGTRVAFKQWLLNREGAAG